MEYMECCIYCLEDAAELLQEHLLATGEGNIFTIFRF